MSMDSLKKLYIKSPNKDVVTLYIASTTDIQKIWDLIKKEEPIIGNIKSRVTRQSIEQAFTHIKTFLFHIPTSKNGYIIVANADGLVWTGDIKVQKDWYWCGGEFYSSILEETLAMRFNPVGIINIETAEATIGYVSTSIEVLQHLTSGIGGKHGKGGQSQRRFEREREQEILMFFQRVADTSNKLFLTSYPISKLLISGGGMTKQKFLDSKYLDYRLKEKLLATLNTQYCGEAGIRETFHLALPKLEQNAYAEEVKAVEGIFNRMGSNFDSIVYGKEELERQMKHIGIIYKLEEIPIEYPDKKVIVLHFKGEHYDKVKGLGGVIGIKM